LAWRLPAWLWHFFFYFSQNPESIWIKGFLFRLSVELKFIGRRYWTDDFPLLIVTFGLGLAGQAMADSLVTSGWWNSWDLSGAAAGDYEGIRETGVQCTGIHVIDP
jgi:hypothetical protein